ncbi:MAG: hypothetical protein OXN25_09030 [Candidatus Poribacteria bacterium]|nr:hypothetical protein [Candidatus Poribacteria bacterium]
MLRLTPLISLISILLVGCTAPAHLMHTSELSQEEKMQQTIAVWKDTHISKALQKWGSPTEVSDDGTGWQTYIWEIPVHGFLAKQESRARSYQLRQDHPIHPRHHRGGMRAVGGRYISTDYTYQLTFYTRPDGVISKTEIKKNYDPTSEFKWK